MNRIWLPAVVIAVVFAGCDPGAIDESIQGGRAGAPPPVVPVVVRSDGIGIPVSLPPEPVVLEVDNRTGEELSLVFGLLGEGITDPDVAGARNNRILDVITISGGTTRIEPRGSDSLTIRFPPGRYVALTPGARAIPPVFFDVVEDESGAVAEPVAEFSLAVGEYYFMVPEDLPAGNIPVSIGNQGGESHELIVTRAGRRVVSLLGPAPDGTIWTTLPLQALGRYRLTCRLLDPRTGRTHADLGMTKTFRVRRG